MIFTIKMASFVPDVKDNVQHDFKDLLKSLSKDKKTDKYLLIDESVDAEANPTFSFGFYTELKDVLAYIIEEGRSYDYEAVFIERNSFTYLNEDNDAGRSTTSIFVGNLKDGDEKIVRLAFEKAKIDIDDRKENDMLTSIKIGSVLPQFLP